MEWGEKRTEKRKSFDFEWICNGEVAVRRCHTFYVCLVDYIIVHVNVNAKNRPNRESEWSCLIGVLFHFDDLCNRPYSRTIIID